MAFCTVNFRSPVLSKACSMDVLLPDMQPGDGPFPVLYLLHGLSDDHTIWQRRTSIERYAAGLPLIVAMPDGARSFYCDAVDGPAYETYMMQDVVGFVDRFFHTVPTREGRAIGGLSMGGYGSLKLALKFPDRFCSVAAHSSYQAITRGSIRDDLTDELRRILGDSPEGGKDDLFAIARGLAPEQAPAIRFDCGADDGLLQHNRDFHAHLDTLGVVHEYEEFPGAHDWGYWDAHVQEALEFHRRALGI